MAATFHHGPEVVEHKDGVSVVRDVKSAVTYVNGTAPIHLIHDTAAKRAEYINKRVVIRTRTKRLRPSANTSRAIPFPQHWTPSLTRATAARSSSTMSSIRTRTNQARRPIRQR